MLQRNVNVVQFLLVVAGIRRSIEMFESDTILNSFQRSTSQFRTMDCRFTLDMR